MRKSVQLGAAARKTCPCFGVLCFLSAFVAALFGAESASADAPVAAAIKATPFAAPAAVLGMTNPYLVASAARLDGPSLKRPRLVNFTFSRDLVDLAHRVERLARYGVELNQRKQPQSDKLNLRVQSRLGGGVLQLYYRR